MATIVEVAALAGVSPAVVSRVANKDATLRINPDTRVRVERAIRELRYMPHHAARALRSRRTDAIMLAIPDATSSVAAPLLRGVEAAARRHDVSVILADAEHALRDPNWISDVVGTGRADGIVLQPPATMSRREMLALASKTVPIVLINDVADGPISTLVLDDAAAVGVAFAHLLENGHHAIGFVGGRPDHPPSERRLAAFRELVHRNRIDVPAAAITSFGFTGDEGRVAARVLLGGEVEPPTAVLVANVNAAMGFLAEAHDLGYALPDQLSVVALVDVWYADATWPPITTVALAFEELAEAAVEVLLAGESTTHQMISDPPPTLMRRASVTTPRS